MAWSPIWIKEHPMQKPDLRCSARYEINWKRYLLPECSSWFESMGSPGLRLRGDKAGVATWCWKGRLCHRQSAAELGINKCSVFLEMELEPIEEGTGIIILLQWRAYLKSFDNVVVPSVRRHRGDDGDNIKGSVVLTQTFLLFRSLPFHVCFFYNEVS